MLKARLSLLFQIAVFVAAVVLIAVLLPDLRRTHQEHQDGDLEGYPWSRADPAAAGMDAEKLADLLDHLRQEHTTAFLVIRNGLVVCEWYAPGHGASVREGCASLTKAVVGSMALGCAIDMKRLSLADKAADHIAPWQSDPLRSRITIAQLAAHRSGLAHGKEADRIPGESEAWRQRFWGRHPDAFVAALKEAPILYTPGERYHYSGPAYAALGYAVTRSLLDSDPPHIRGLLQDRIMGPMGIPDSDWGIGYERDFRSNGLTLHAIWSGARFTPRAVAAIGYLMMHRGSWEGHQLLRADVVESLRTPPAIDVEDGGLPARPAVALGWWSNGNGFWESVPRDAHLGVGAGHQILLVVPSKRLIAVRFGMALGGVHWGGPFWRLLEEHLLDPLMSTLSDPPYPWSNLICEVRFAPADSIVCRAPGSDNWPNTWGGDDAIYAAYGDGYGFAPHTEKKLSLGLVRVEGPPDSFHGVNLRTPSGERTGEGPNGEKASGMLMVADTLYMFVRNAGNSRLLWSADAGSSWETSFTFRESFGHPVFLNFGRNYSGSRDDFVYVYSSDGRSAYQSYDHLVLARVSRHRIRERAAYEFYGGTDSVGAPLWVRSLAERAPVFTYPDHCRRMDAVHHPGIDRYLLALAYDHQGGWGIFDAPEPWGPWTTSYHTLDWGLGRTHDYKLPSRWIDRAGLELKIVFSGKEFQGVNYDAFCVRGVRLSLCGGIRQSDSHQMAP